MGAEHGVYCVGCCWALMLLLFVGGVMNLLWVAAIGVFVLLEKLGARTRVARWISGAGLIVGGGAVMSGRGPPERWRLASTDSDKPGSGSLWRRV